eukprot:TRINITY_DN5654_c0_g1_i1.p1 TRINITY_DN5654_c0_g1~~TRINITY_DN5654_c0_g1_i1.p1  ORF type:complete len:415 (+),score=174.42 TRINITY_DN5654_c0_g1_i1:60-1304(+)
MRAAGCLLLGLAWVEAAPPVVVLPGLMGSMLEVDVDPNATLPALCAAKQYFNGGEKTRLWADVGELSIDFACFEFMAGLATNNETFLSESPAGVTVTAPKDGIKATSCLDPANAATCLASSYLKGFLDYMIESHNYTLAHDVDVVAYDWRVSPYNHYRPGGFFETLKARIERMAADNDGQRVTLTGHSMGGYVGALFLNTYVDAAWKDRYINAWVSVAGVYAGAGKAMGALLYGGAQGFPFAHHLVFDILKGWGGMMALLPSNAPGAAVWPSNFTAIQIGEKKYSVDELQAAMEALGQIPSAHLTDKLRSLDSQSPPGVKAHCVFARGSSTAVAAKFKSAEGLARWYPETLHGDGDGTVPIESLSVCNNWAGRQPQHVAVHEFPPAMVKGSHFGLMAFNSGVWEVIARAAADSV